jgi:MATE family, multidrug efflux pump
VNARRSRPLVYLIRGFPLFSPDLVIMKDLTQGSVASHVLAMAVPTFAGLILVLLCGLIDLYFVAGLGEAAVAGVGAAGNAGFLVSALTQVVSVGTLAAISQAVGRKDRTDATVIFNQSLGLALACAVCTLAVGVAVARPYMSSVAADADTVAAGTTYLIWFMPALALQFPLLAMASALRGLGVVRPTMYVQALVVIINIALAPVLVLGWGTGYALGVQGAGLASTLAIALGVAALWAFMQNAESYLALDPRHWRPRLTPWRRILSVGLPAGGEFAIIFAYMAAIYHVLADFGPAAQAGFSIGTRMLGLIQVPAMAIAFTAAPMIGQNFGAGHVQRVKATVRHVLIATTGVMIAATALTQWQSLPLLQGFTRDQATIAEGAVFLNMVSLNLVAQGLIFVCSSAFQGLGNTRPQLIGSTVRLITYVIPILWLSAQSGFRVEQIWYVSIATTALQALLSLWLLGRELRIRLGMPQQALAPGE